MEKAAKHPDAKDVLQDWCAATRTAKWRSLVDVREVYPATDMVGVLAIFNIKGNRYRLIVRAEFQRGCLYIKEFLTHAEYDKGAWKKWLH